MVIMDRPFKEDKEIERELEKQKISEAMLLRYMARPSLARRHVTRAEFEMLRQEVGSTRRIVEIHDAQIANHEARIAFLEAQSRKIQKSDNLKATSDKNVKQLRELFNLPEIKGEVEGDILAEMRGMLGEYSEEGIDSVELLRSVRDEWG